jgi:flagellar M-ring protein FliF
VAVSNQGPGKVKRLSVAVALSQKAMAKAKQTDIDQIKQLVSAAVGADASRGDQVAVVVRSFDAPVQPTRSLSMKRHGSPPCCITRWRWWAC